MLPLRPGARPAKSPSLPSLESCWCWPMPCSATAPLTKHGQTPFVQKPLDTLHSYLLRCAACAARTECGLHFKANGAHQRQGVAVANDAGLQAVIKLHLTILEVVGKVDVGGAGAELFGDVRQR